MAGTGELFLGLDIGGTKCAAVVGGRDGRILARIQWPSNSARGPEAMIDELCVHGTRLVGQHPTIAAVGASIGGPLDSERGIILSPPNLPGWDRVPLRDELKKRFGLRARVEHDAAACALAEHRWGKGIGKSRVIYLTCGTGFGAGFVIDGEIYRGAAGRSPEIGHARFREVGPEAFGKIGSVEAYCAGASLGKLAAWKFPQRWTTLPNSEQLADLWRGGDREAGEIIESNARAIGEVCANLGDFLRPDIILLGSLATYLGEKWVEIVRARFREEALADTAMCPIEPAGLGERLQDCSALVVAVSAQPLST
jgi:glucokinase